VKGIQVLVGANFEFLLTFLHYLHSSDLVRRTSIGCSQQVDAKVFFSQMSNRSLIREDRTRVFVPEETN